VHYVQTIAAELDGTQQVLRENEIDLVAVRIEPLDILTHAHFAEAVSDGQDDGQGLLFEVYRYLDARIGALHPYLDGDDVLIVMSDHGIRTAMEHDRPAMFVATGAGVPVGRAGGNPSLRGVSRVLADLLGVATDWPDTGVASWASERAVAHR
jgi:predicted AlkP superfamily phosphohydrolase/phosphomutase